MLSALEPGEANILSGTNARLGPINEGTAEVGTSLHVCDFLTLQELVVKSFQIKKSLSQVPDTSDASKTHSGLTGS